jgi:hypothetical protein
MAFLLILLLLALMAGCNVLYVMVDTATPALVFMLICGIITSIVWNILFPSKKK